MNFQSGGDLVIAESFGGKENHLGAHNIKIWQRTMPTGITQSEYVAIFMPKCI